MRCGNTLLFCAWVILAGCGGATSEPGSGGATGTGGASGAGGSSGSGGTRASGGDNAGGFGTGETPPDCTIPTEPVYSCKMRPHQTGDCAPWVPPDFAADSVVGGYAPGCGLITTLRSGFSGCGPLTCTCEAFPGSNGEWNDWVCPD